LLKKKFPLSLSDTPSTVNSIYGPQGFGARGTVDNDDDGGGSGGGGGGVLAQLRSERSPSLSCLFTCAIRKTGSSREKRATVVRTRPPVVYPRRDSIFRVFHGPHDPPQP